MQHFRAYLENKLKELYPTSEIKAFARILLRDVAGLSSAQIYSDKDTKIPDATAQRLNVAVDRLAAGEPIQYVVGKTVFFDLSFRVQPGVLIPRPETEELVDLILQDVRKKGPHEQLQLLDIGTGSGCIAVSLAHQLPDCRVTAWDISSEALDIAAENAELNKVFVEFRQTDVLALQPSPAEEAFWNVIVSNPPYVRECEKADMESHVLDHEPHRALFVTDEDPLLFYRTIATHALHLLKRGGMLYFEINSHLGQETLDLLRGLGFENVELHKDIAGRDRMIRAKR